MSFIVPRNKPDRCTNCPFMDRITYDCMLMYGNDYSDFKSQYEHCPLIELPPHGDLVDRNELLAEYDRQHEGEAGKARKIMEQAETVIEGSET